MMEEKVILHICFNRWPATHGIRIMAIRRDQNTQEKTANDIRQMLHSKGEKDRGEVEDPRVQVSQVEEGDSEIHGRACVRKKPFSSFFVCCTLDCFPSSE